MKKLLPILLSAIALTAMVSSCKKDDTVVITDSNYTVELKALIDSLRPAPQTFNVNIGNITELSGAKGSLVLFYGNSFRYADGSAVTSGTVQVSLREAYTPGEMISNFTHTVTASGLPLISRGQMEIKATLNGQALKADHYTVGFHQNSFSAQPMGLFYSAPFISNDDPITWEDSMSAVVTKTDVHNNQNVYLFDSLSDFTWINCDHYLDTSGAKTNIKVILPEDFDGSNAVVFAVIPDRNYVMVMPEFHENDNTYNTNRALPVGLGVRIVVIASKDGQHYANVLNETPLIMAASFTIVPQPKTLNQIQTMLAGL